MSDVGRQIATIASLKWHLLLGGMRRGSPQRAQTILAIVVSVFVGSIGLLLLHGLGRTASIADELLVVFMPLVVAGVGLLSASTGVESSVDPRNLATEPISTWSLGLGMLLAATIGPPALLAVLTGAGIVTGWASGGAVGLVVVVAAVLGWWVTLVLASRTVANLLGTLANTRLAQVAQVAASLSAVLAWLLVQVLAGDADGWDPQRWDRLAGIAAWTPPGQLARAIGAAASPGDALVHLLAGWSWLPLLVWASVWSTGRLALSSPRPGGRGTAAERRRAVRGERLLGRLVPDSPTGSLAARTVRTKIRTPRQAVNTLTALAIGAGVFLLGPLFDANVDPRAVIVAGMLHFAVLFDGNNAFGMDGPALWSEVAAGADGKLLVRAKVLSSMIVMTGPALVVPIGMAALTGGWAWVPAGWLVAAGSVLAAAGVAIASASIAPVAMPDSPNPLAAGDTGQGCVAGLLLAVCMTVLGLASAPVAVAIYFASTQSPALAALAAIAAPVVGALVLWGGMSAATARLTGREERLIDEITPAR